MCGILAVLSSAEDPDEIRARVVTLAKLIRHRGPDWSGVHLQRNVRNNGRDVVNVLAHERLAIVDPAGGQQPLIVLLLEEIGERNRLPGISCMCQTSVGVWLSLPSSVLPGLPNRSRCT